MIKSELNNIDERFVDKKTALTEWLELPSPDQYDFPFDEAAKRFNELNKRGEKYEIKYIYSNSRDISGPKKILSGLSIVRRSTYGYDDKDLIFERLNGRLSGGAKEIPIIEPKANAISVASIIAKIV